MSSFLASIIATISQPPTFLLTGIGLGTLLWTVHWLLIGRHELNNERKFPRQLVMIGLTLASIVVFLLSLPVSEDVRDQLIGLAGLLISGIFAFSSGNIFANLAAGILLRVTKPFRIGDFIYVKEYFGRVAERGLFDTEIQSENRELIAIPNSLLVSNPVTTVRSSGAIVSAELSLGYDVHHTRIEALLIQAAEQSGLTEAFVLILALGNYAITYRISGMLTEVKGLISVRSTLYRAVLDTLHDDGVEIMSPTYMNQRRVAEDQQIIPSPTVEQTTENSATPEEIVFDKAEQAEQLDKEKNDLADTIEQLEEALKTLPESEHPRIKEEIKNKHGKLEALKKTTIESQEDP